MYWKTTSAEQFLGMFVPTGGNWRTTLEERARWWPQSPWLSETRMCFPMGVQIEVWSLSPWSQIVQGFIRGACLFFGF